MRTIYKYPLGNAPSQRPFAIEMPAGAEILTVQVQRRQACIWALVDPTAETETREFYLAETGRLLDLAGDGQYIDTFQLEQVGLVWHLFEVAP